MNWKDVVVIGLFLVLMVLSIGAINSYAILNDSNLRLRNVIGGSFETYHKQ